MIKVQNLKVTLGEKNILNDVSFEVPSQTTLALLGRNGCGKSVLLKSIAGLLPISGGEITINEISVNDKAENKGFEYSKLAYVFQKGGLFDFMDVANNTAFGLRRIGKSEEEISQKIEAVLRRVGLAGNETKMPSELSGGMQKRVGLARAICMDPEIILYDDPAAGLDPVLSDSIADLLLEIKDIQCATSIVVTHDLKLARKISDFVVLLYNGKNVFYGETEDFFSGQDEFAKQFISGDLMGPMEVM